MSDLTLTDQERGGVLVGLGEDRSTELAVVGGKGASLGRLVKADFPVPPGFVITTDAYAACLRANDLEEKIEKVLGKLDYGNLDQVEEETAKVRDAIVGCKLPDGLVGEIVRAYGELGDEPYVAVRSSGTAEDPPMFLKGDEPMDLDHAADGESDSVLRGVGTSPGLVTGRARIVPTQKDIGRLEQGDILVCHGTDPGWTPAFSIVSGVVAQTGGMLAHFSCLSREYGMPAVSLPNAMKLIEDGSVITLNGGTGEVRLAQSLN